ncbi:membrane protein [Conyzicola lurida]|uniref:Membrane protein n=1 Tax=Conyzicola lurida TaxID=1172621 RepID=A0A841APP6_9MICO|nr:YihY/virulence factor BrkB family protein [Conyzicola lurida]MBB5844278.1 membrane protein [Conyzicola lurida]
MADNTTQPPAAPTGIAAIIAKVMKLKPVRVFQHYSSSGGPLMASGLANQGLFATFAGLWVGFSIIGLVVAGNPELRESLVDTIANAVPGLIKSGGTDGAIDPDDLLSAGILNWTGAIALVGLFFTAVGFLASAREAVRRIFAIAPDSTNFILLKLKDLGLAVGFGVALIVSTVLSTVSTSALSWFLAVTGIGAESTVGTIGGRIVGLLVVLVIDTAVLAALYRVLAGIPIPFRRLVGGALIGGVGLGVLKLLGGLLLGGASNNPLIASFAIIAGLLIFLNLVCQVILVAAAWISVGMDDAGIAADPVAAAKAQAERERIAELERVAEKAREPHGLARLFRRKRRADDDGGDS